MKGQRKKATVNLETHLCRAMRMKGAKTGRGISDLIKEAVRLALAEDAEDLTAFAERRKEPSLPFELVAKKLAKRSRSR
jgi:hypothetical protein